MIFSVQPTFHLPAVLLNLLADKIMDKCPGNSYSFFFFLLTFLSISLLPRPGETKAKGFLALFLLNVL